METWEIMQRKGKFKRKSDGLMLEVEKDGTIKWDSGYKHLNTNDDWEEIKEPVDFITAIKSGRHIGYKYERGEIKK